MPRLISHRIGFYAGLSCLFHVVGGIVWWQLDTDSVAATKASQSTAISVGLQAAMAGAQQSSAAIQPEVVQKEVPSPPAPVAVPEEAFQEIAEEPSPEPEPPVETDVASPVEQQRQVVEKSEPAPREAPDPVVTDVPDPIEKEVPPPKIEPVEQPHPRREAVDNTPVEEERIETVVGHGGEEGASTQGAALEETGIAQADSADVDNRYDLRVRQHLLENKQTPRVMGARRMEGVVTVEFTLDRNGNVLNHEVVGLSRVREFDQAGARLVERAMPFPSAPADISWQSRVYTIDVRYQVK
ncbi:energy transducer TonB [Halomonas aquamarina]|uniref:Energy transducer TonB n=1 Tax=Vreelandella aquamarina TaxID=77097 RepID=A0ACC5VUP5_9GAMM|nr:energy transducer TonB [Halomonas aquamarina]MBZ5488028.1 energy transducer TonB [Halomonas aquamarina]